MNLSVALGVTLGFVGSTALYLGSPNQRLRRTPLSARVARSGAAASYCASLATFLLALQPLVAMYAFSVSVMLALVVVPYAGALKQKGDGLR